MLSFLAHFLVCTPSAAKDLQDHVVQLLGDSLEGGDVENTIVAFLLTRQSCMEGPHVFPAYPQWFKLAYQARPSSFLTLECPDSSFDF
ncbi:Fanconi anemia group A protein-like [Babylonia areolata]|uniref:Fanconi anemia group A protein-like n=1 Tax=Babylonia areolata TaxID=304850 RepID=UPI003FD52025